MQVLQATSQSSENFKKSGLTASFCKWNEKSELNLNQDNETSVLDIAVHVTHESGKGLFGFCIQILAM